MSSLKKDFIANTIRDQAEVFTYNTADVRLPKSFRAYLLYIYKTDGSRALIRGLILLLQRIFLFICVWISRFLYNRPTAVPIYTKISGTT